MVRNGSTVRRVDCSAAWCDVGDLNVGYLGMIVALRGRVRRRKGVECAGGGVCKPDS